MKEIPADVKAKMENKSNVQTGKGILGFRDSVIEAAEEYEKTKFIKTGVAFWDECLLGGMEAGNFYLLLGPAKSGKSTFLRALAIAATAHQPVLYVNMEQIRRNITAKIFEVYTGTKSFRELVEKKDADFWDALPSIPDIPLVISGWQESITNRAFNKDTGAKLQESLDEVERQYGRKPLIVLENLTDIYNDPSMAKDNMVNIAGQTAQDIKTFCMTNGVACVLAHHTPKLQDTRPSLDDARDSKRIVDLANSIFCCFAREFGDKDTGEVQKREYYLAYIAGRGSEHYAQRRLELGNKYAVRFM